MKRIIKISLLAILLLAQSCDKQTIMMSQSYLLAFENIEDVYNAEMSYKNDNVLELKIRATGYVSILSYGEDKLKYLSLCEKFNDLSYNREVRFIKGPHVSFTADIITNIDIISDTDFGLDYPAGTSLRDITIIETYSAYPFVLGGYISKTPDDYRIENWTKINKRLSELEENDLSLLPLGFLDFRFDLIPEEKNHNLTVTLTLDDGRVLTNTFAMQFESVE